MRKIILVCLLVLIKMAASGQKIRVFNTVSLDYNFSKKHLSPDIQIGQSLLLESAVPVRFNAAIKLSGDLIQKGDIPNIRTKSESYLNLKKMNFSPAISIPVGFEAGFDKLAFGISFDLVSFNIGKKLDSLKYSIEDADGSLPGLEVKPQRANFLLSKSSNRSVDANIYITYTYNDSFSFRAGFWKHNVLYQSSIKPGSLRQKYDKFGFEEIKPFIGIRFNLEK